MVPTHIDPSRVSELVAQYWAHHPARRDPRRCVCGMVWPCSLRRMAKAELLESGNGAAVWR